ncbi:MAG: FHA domain-containing protein, partial [Candidatus Brocadiales bacterium]
MRIVVVHISGSKRGRTEVFSAERLKIGTDPVNDLCFDPTVDRNTAPFHAEIELKDCDYLFRNKAVNTFVNGQEVAEVILRDGDMVEFGEGGPKVRFRLKGEEGDVCKPFREMLEDSVAIAREEHKGGLVTASTFFKELVWEALTQSSLRFRIGLAFGVFLVLFLTISGLYSSVSQRQLEKEVEQRLQEAAERIETLEAKGVVAERIIRDFTGGVCLIQGTYGFGEDIEKGV